MAIQNIIGGRLKPVIKFSKKGGLVTGSDLIQRPRWLTTNSESDIVTQKLYLDDYDDSPPYVDDIGFYPEYKGEQRVMANGGLRQFFWGSRFRVTFRFDWVKGQLLRDIINNFHIYSKGWLVLSDIDFPNDGIWVVASPEHMSGLHRFRNTVYGHTYTLSLIGTDLYPAGTKLPLYIKITDDFASGFWTAGSAVDPDFNSYKE